MTMNSRHEILNTLRHHYGIAKGFILPLLLIVGPCMLLVTVVSRNHESCKKAKARGEKCQSIWWTATHKDKAIDEEAKKPVP